MVKPGAKSKAAVPSVPAKDDDDDKPLAALYTPEPKANAKAKAKPKSEATAIQKERAQQSRKKEDEAPLSVLIEQPIPKPKKRAKVTPAKAKEEDATNVLRASKKAAAAPQSRARPERFLISLQPTSQKRDADDDAPISQLKRRRRLKWNQILIT